jgi:hypothetical protein
MTTLPPATTRGHEASRTSGDSNPPNLLNLPNLFNLLNLFVSPLRQEREQVRHLLRREDLVQVGGHR